jgi:hypothetical protein
MLTAYLHTSLHNICNPRCQVCALFSPLGQVRVYRLCCLEDGAKVTKLPKVRPGATQFLPMMERSGTAILGTLDAL